MGKNPKIETLSKVKDLIKEFDLILGRIQQYSDVPENGLKMLIKGMNEIISLQDTLEPKLNINSNKEENLKVFTEWFLKNGGKLSKCEIKTNVDEGSGIVATETIQEGERVITVPEKLILSSSRVMKDSKYAKYFKSESKLLEIAQLPLIFYLLSERKKPKSFWKPYFDVLPDSFDTLSFWSIPDLQLLAGSPTLDDTLLHMITICKRYCVSYSTLLGAVGAPISLTTFSLKNFFWAQGVLDTRRNSVPVNGRRPEDCLIPMWDMCNHRQGRITTMYDIAAKECQCDAQVDTAVGEQVSIFYGARSIGQLLLFSGFVPPADDAHDKVALHLVPPTGDRDNPTRLALLKSAGIPPAPYFMKRNDIDDNALQFVRCLALSGQALAAASPETLKAPLAATVAEKLALDLLKGAATEVLNGYRLKIDESMPLDDIAAESAEEAVPPSTNNKKDKWTAALTSNAQHAATARQFVARERSIIQQNIECIDKLLAALPSE